MDAKTPAELADAAAEAVRSANHATLTAPALGWEVPSDAYDVIGHLLALVERLPQLFEQTGEHVRRLAAAGHVRSDHGGGGTAEVTATLDALSRASADAVAMAAALDTAHGALSPLAWDDDAPCSASPSCPCDWHDRTETED